MLASLPLENARKVSTIHLINFRIIPTFWDTWAEKEADISFIHVSQVVRQHTIETDCRRNRGIIAILIMTQQRVYSMKRTHNIENDRY